MWAGMEMLICSPSAPFSSCMARFISSTILNGSSSPRSRSSKSDQRFAARPPNSKALTVRRAIISLGASGVFRESVIDHHLPSDSPAQTAHLLRDRRCDFRHCEYRQASDFYLNLPIGAVAYLQLPSVRNRHTPLLDQFPQIDNYLRRRLALQWGVKSTVLPLVRRSHHHLHRHLDARLGNDSS
jgi:hypothetical protein